MVVHYLSCYATLAIPDYRELADGMNILTQPDLVAVWRTLPDGYHRLGFRTRPKRCNRAWARLFLPNLANSFAKQLSAAAPRYRSSAW